MKKLRLGKGKQLTKGHCRASDTCYLLQRRCPTAWTAKKVAVPATRNSSPRISTHHLGCRAWGPQERHDSHRCWMEQHFTEETEQDQLQQWALVPHGHWVSPYSRHGQWSAYTPLVLQVEDPVPSPPGTGRAGRLTRCQMTPMCKQNKKVSIQSGTGKDIPQTKRCGQPRTCGLFLSL